MIKKIKAKNYTPLTLRTVLEGGRQYILRDYCPLDYMDEKVCQRCKFHKHNLPSELKQYFNSSVSAQCLLRFANTATYPFRRMLMSTEELNTFEGIWNNCLDVPFIEDNY